MGRVWELENGQLVHRVALHDLADGLGVLHFKHSELGALEVGGVHSVNKCLSLELAKDWVHFVIQERERLLYARLGH